MEFINNFYINRLSTHNIIFISQIQYKRTHELNNKMYFSIRFSNQSIWKRLSFFDKNKKINRYNSIFHIHEFLMHDNVKYFLKYI